MIRVTAIVLLLVGFCSLAQGADDGYGGSAEYDEEGYQSTADYATRYVGSPSPPITVIDVIPIPNGCGCNRNSPCFNKKTNTCHKAQCHTYDRVYAKKRDKGDPTVRVLDDPKDPNAIIISVDTSVLDTLDDDANTGGDAADVTSGNDDAAAGAIDGYGEMYYGDSYYAKVCLPCACPAGTSRCSDFNRLMKWGDIFLVLSIVAQGGAGGAFFFKAMTSPVEMRLFKFVASVICTISALAGLIIILGHGYYIRCWDQRHFYYVRYVDWMLTAPQILWILSAMARGGTRETRSHPFGRLDPANPKMVVDANLVLMAVASVMMIASGLVGSFLEANDKWAFWVFGWFCFVPIAAVLLRTVPANLGTARLTYKIASRLTIFSWSLYGIIWLFDEGVGLMSIDGEMIAYFFLDLFSKVVFGIIVVVVPWEVP